MGINYTLENKLNIYVNVPLSGLAMFANFAQIYLLCHKSHKKPFSILLIGLAISNVITSLGIVLFSVIPYVFHGEEDLKSKTGSWYYLLLAVASVLNFGILSSWLHIVLIAFDRWVAVFRPLDLRRFTSKFSRKLIVTIIWILSSLIIGSVSASNELAALGKVIAAFIIGSNLFILMVYFSIIKKIKESCEIWKNREGDIPSNPSSANAKHEKSVVMNCLLITLLFVTMSSPILYSLITEDYSYMAVFFALITLDKLVNPGIYFFKSYCSCGRKTRAE